MGWRRRWRRSGAVVLLMQLLGTAGVRRSSAEDGGTQALVARRWGGGFSALG